MTRNSNLSLLPCRTSCKCFNPIPHKIIIYTKALLYSWIKVVNSSYYPLCFLCMFLFKVAYLKRLQEAEPQAMEKRPRSYQYQNKNQVHVLPLSVCLHLCFCEQYTLVMNYNDTQTLTRATVSVNLFLIACMHLCT